MDWNWPAPNQIWLGALHRGELGEVFIEKSKEQTKEVI